MRAPPLRRRIARTLAAACGFALAAGAAAADRAQWGEYGSRNQVSDERGLPAACDPTNGRNIAWTACLGTDSYATPSVAGGRVYVGGNNGRPRDPKHHGDRGVLFCFDARDGRLCWQLVMPKRGGDIYLDWPNSGICSPATIDGDRAYVLNNRGQVLGLDVAGMTNGNDGPFRDEGPLMSPPGEPTLEPGPLDADVIWVRDLVADCGIYTHDAAHANPLLLDGRLYLNTGNGVDNTHRKIRCPDAPSLVVLDAATGRWLARDGERIGPRIFHCTWSSPALLRAGGRDQIVFGGGDGIVYGFAAGIPAGPAPVPLVTRWRFDIDPTSPKEDVHQYVGNRQESPSTCKAMPVVHEGRVYVVAGGDRWWGKPQTWLACLDPSGTGDVTKTASKWVYSIDAHSMSTPSVCGGRVYVADAKGRIHCVDASTGKPAWVYESRGEMWGSTLVADGKVYAGNRRGELHVLAEGRELKPLAVSRLDAPIAGTPVAANGTLYVPTAKTLYALRASPR